MHRWTGAQRARGQGEEQGPLKSATQAPEKPADVSAGSLRIASELVPPVPGAGRGSGAAPFASPKRRYLDRAATATTS